MSIKTDNIYSNAYPDLIMDVIITGVMKASPHSTPPVEKPAQTTSTAEIIKNSKLAKIFIH